jgi:hypothetical protein
VGITRTIGPYWDAGLEASSPTDRHATIRLGVPYRTFRVAERSDLKVAHYFGIVRPGLMGAARLFRGVNRRMKYYDDMAADKSVFAYVWQPSDDVRPVPQMDGTMRLRKCPPPPGRVFATLVRPYRAADSFGIEGAILHWNWMDGDSNMCPIDQEERYDQQVW